MPHNFGSAFVAEVLLYSLWAKYINGFDNNNYERRIFIKETILLDIEALTLPFDKFYENCFTTKKTKYTPYFTII